MTLKEDYPKILPESDAARKLAAKVEDVNRFLVTRSDIIRGLEGSGLSVTYHDPCHLNYGMGVKAEPRELLKAASGGSFVEMNEAERCCGFGGSFSFLDYRLSGKIAGRKAGNAAATMADVVATACPGCMMHLRDALKQAGKKVEAMHTLQVIEKSLK